MNALLTKLNPFDSALYLPVSSVAQATATVASEAVAEPIQESAPSLNLDPVPTTPAATVTFPVAADFSEIETSTKYVVEYFSDYVARRTLPKVSPQRNVDELIDLDAIYAAAVSGHPRDLDVELPLFLRSPAFHPEETRGVVDSLMKLARLK